MSPKNSKWSIAVLASGNGTNLQALIDACADETINGEIKVVVSSKRHAYALVRARQANIETLVFETEKFNSRTLHCAKIAKALNERGIELVLLAGYMLKLEPCMIRGFPRRILNIHPALLPKYGGKGMYGNFVHAAVLAAKETESGCSVHMVDEIYDNGHVLAQAKVSVSATETAESLATKIHEQEHKLYVSVVKKVCAGEIDLDQFQNGAEVNKDEVKA